MTAALISFGSTILAILLVSTIRTEGRLSRVDSRLDHVESRLARVDDRLDHVESRLDRVESRLDHVESRLDRVEDKLDQMGGSLGRVEAKLDIITAHLVPVSQLAAAPQTDADTAQASASESASEISQQAHSVLASSN